MKDYGMDIIAQGLRMKWKDIRDIYFVFSLLLIWL
jgi:hypothetical protein